MIKALMFLLRGVVVAAALLSPNRGSVFVQAAEISVHAQEPAAAASVVHPWDDEHRALQSAPSCLSDSSCCMLANYDHYTKGGTKTSLGCGSNSVQFNRVDGFTVFDADSKKCNCGCTDCPACNNVTSPVNCQSEDRSTPFPLGTVIGACRGLDDVVTLQFRLTLTVSNAEYDIGLYINTVGGNGKCESLGSRRGMAGSFGRCRLPIKLLGIEFFTV